eukprot:2860510-Rhodomonas_salina.1
MQRGCGTGRSRRGPGGPGSRSTICRRCSGSGSSSLRCSPRRRTSAGACSRSSGCGATQGLWTARAACVQLHAPRGRQHEARGTCCETSGALQGLQCTAASVGRGCPRGDAREEARGTRRMWVAGASASKQLSRHHSRRFCAGGDGSTGVALRVSKHPGEASGRRTSGGFDPRVWLQEGSKTMDASPSHGRSNSGAHRLKE